MGGGTSCPGRGDRGGRGGGGGGKSRHLRVGYSDAEVAVSKPPMSCCSGGSKRGERSCELKAGHADGMAHTASVHPCILCSSVQLTGFQAKQLTLSTTLQGFQASVYRVDSAELKHTVGASAKQAVQYQKLKSV